MTSLTGPSPAGTVDTPVVIVDGEGACTNGRKFFRSPPLPSFSGAVPVPKGEGSFEQHIFQVKGFRST